MLQAVIPPPPGTPVRSAVGIHASAGAADAATGRAVERDVTTAAQTGQATSTEPVIHEFQAGPSLEPSWQQGEAERPLAAARELQQRGRAEQIAITDAEVTETPARPPQSPATDPGAAAQRKAGQTARFEAGRRALADLVVQASLAAGAAAGRYGAAAHAKTEAEAEPASPEQTHCLENMGENRAGIDAIGGRAKLADREAEQRAQVGQELAREQPVREPEPEAEPELQTSWRQGQAERPSAPAAPDAGASLDTPEIGTSNPSSGSDWRASRS
jgi:hypothetical protein